MCQLNVSILDFQIKSRKKKNVVKTQGLPFGLQSPIVLWIFIPRGLLLVPLTPFFPPPTASTIPRHLSRVLSRIVTRDQQGVQPEKRR